LTNVRTTLLVSELQHAFRSDARAPETYCGHDVTGNYYLATCRCMVTGQHAPVTSQSHTCATAITRTGCVQKYASVLC